MKKNVQVLAFVAMVLVLFVACTNDEDFPLVNNSNEIRVLTSIDAMTRVATEGLNSYFENGDRILVYGWTGDKTVVPANPPIVAENTLTIENSVKTWVAQPQMLWLSQTAAHYFLGIYPVRTVTNFSADAYLLDETKQEEADLLVALSDDQGIVANNRGVDLTFEHVMAKIEINMNFRNQWEETPTPSEVKLYCGKEATIKYLTRTATADAYLFDATKYIAMPAMDTPVTGFDKSYSSVVIPQAGVNIVDIVVDGIPYRYEGVEDIPFTKGKITTLNLNVGKDGVSLAGVAVGGWSEGETLEGGEAEEVIHPYVDLGLPSGLLWAKCNIGATVPEEIGDYFAWGETAPKTSYNFKSEGDYKYGVYDYQDTDNYGTTKYNNIDGKTTLEAIDDAATTILGSEWRTPTVDEFNELLTKCTWTATSRNDVSGYEVKGQNGNSIFIPVSGYRRIDDLNAPTSGYYWTSTLVQSEVRSASILQLDIMNGASISGSMRYFGLPVRAVWSTK